MKFNHKNKLFNRIIAITLLTSIFVSSTVLKTYAHNAYFIGVTVDTSRYKYQSIVSYDDAFSEGGHKEVKLGDFANKNRNWKTIKVPEVSSTIDPDERSKQYTDVGNGDGGNGLIYSFPGIHTNSMWGSTDANDNDKERAQWVSENLTTGYNDALSFIFANTEYKISKQNNSKDLFVEVSSKIANKSKEAMVNGSSSLVLNGKTINFSKNATNETTILGTEKSDYINITIDGNSSNFLYKVNKGYISGPLSSQVPEKIKSELNTKDAEYLTWSHIALQGNYNYDVKNITFSNIAEITKPGKIEQMINDLLNSLLTSLRQLLGLHSMQELMLNEGSRDTTYFYGIMPMGWFNSAMVLHVICQFLAWALLIGAIVKLLVSRSVATINTAMRIDLIEGAQDILITGLALSVIIPAFYIISILNYKLVAIFAKSSDAVSLFGGNMESGYGGLLAGIIVMIMLFVINVYFNFVYIMRAITVSILLAFSPLFVVSIAFGGKYKQIFSNFMSEFIGHTFMQSIHAMIIAFISSVFAGGGMRMIYSLVLSYSFIPLTTFFQKNLFGIGGGFAGDTAKGITSSLATITSSTLGSGKKKESSGSESSGSSSSSSGSSSGGSPIKTASSDSIRENQNANNQLYSKDISGENSSIPNAELTKPSYVSQVKDKIASTKVGGAISDFASSKGGEIAGEAISGVGKVAGKVGVGLIQTGIALGTASTGDKMSSSIASMNAGRNFKKAVSGGLDNINDIGNEIVYGGNSPDLKDYKSQDSGYLYHKELGDGYNEYHLNSESLEEDTGISKIQDTDNRELSMEYDFDERTGEFENEALNNATEYSGNFRSMVYAFKNKDEEAISRYKEQGINNVVTKDGKVKVTYDKKKTGIRRATSSGGKTILEMSENNDFRLKNMIPQRDKLPV